MSINNLENHEFYTRLKKVIRPASPISTFELLFGREKQISDIESVLYSDGRSVFIYGDRGVGKTSLAHTIAYKLQEEKEPILVGCEPSSTLSSIINDILFKGISHKEFNPEKTSTIGVNLGVDGYGLNLEKTTKTIQKEQVLNINTISSAVSALGLC